VPGQRDLAHASLDFLEAIYAWYAPDDEWLGRAVSAAWELWGRPAWAIGMFYDASDVTEFRYSNLVFAGASDEARAFVPTMLRALPPDVVASTYRSRVAGFGESVSGGRGPSWDELSPQNVVDVFGINGLDPSGLGCFVGIATTRSAATPAQVELSHRLAAHLAAAYHCRRTLRGEAGRALDAEPAPGLVALSERQQQVVIAAASGKTTKEIAHELGISASTARVQLSRAFARLGVRSRGELMRLPTVRALRGAAAGSATNHGFAFAHT
jgi:DNA-binding CsgD family transcriptional regulator